MIEINCKCGNQITERTCSPKALASYLTESSEDKYTDFIALELEEYALAMKEGNLKSWFEERAGKVFPDDLSEGTVMYDVLGKSQQENMNQIFECDNCGSMNFVKDGEVFCFESSNGYQALFDDNKE